jgi:hypothetical protein
MGHTKLSGNSPKRCWFTQTPSANISIKFNCGATQFAYCAMLAMKFKPARAARWTLLIRLLSIMIYNAGADAA